MHDGGSPRRKYECLISSKGTIFAGEFGRHPNLSRSFVYLVGAALRSRRPLQLYPDECHCGCGSQGSPSLCRMAHVRVCSEESPALAILTLDPIPTQIVSLRVSWQSTKMPVSHRVLDIRSCPQIIQGEQSQRPIDVENVVPIQPGPSAGLSCFTGIRCRRPDRKDKPHNRVLGAPHLPALRG